MSDMARGKKGQILMLALLVMFVGAVILAGLFQYLGSSLLLATKGEENAVNYYAADSGIEDALYWLQNGQEDQGLWAWNEGEEQWEREGYTLNYSNNADNNRAVDVIVKNNPSGCGDNCYLITSKATHNKSGVSTIIESYIRQTPLEFYRFGDDAITSNKSVDIKQGDQIQGNVSYVDYTYCNNDPKETDDCPVDGKDCCELSVNGSMNHAPNGIDWWPETWAITKYFKDQVDILNPFVDVDAKNTLNAEDFPTLGPLYRDGDLNIKDSTCNKPEICPRRITLDGTVFITGHLTMGGDEDFILDLNGQVIFVEYDGEKPDEAIIIDQKCHIEGPGAIFAIGSIIFKPSIETPKDDFLFVMSIDGGTHLQPNGAFYGSVVGHDYVNVWPGNGVIYNDSDILWNQFPDDDVRVMKVLTYDIVDR